MATTADQPPDWYAQKAMEHARNAKVYLKDQGLIELATAVEYLGIAVGRLYQTRDQ